MWVANTHTHTHTRRDCDILRHRSAFALDSFHQVAHLTETCRGLRVDAAKASGHQCAYWSGNMRGGRAKIALGPRALGQETQKPNDSWLYTVVICSDRLCKCFKTIQHPCSFVIHNPRSVRRLPGHPFGARKDQHRRTAACPVTVDDGLWFMFRRGLRRQTMPKEDAFVATPCPLHS